ncbi:MAG: GNAT family N-acetyltransferase [Coriobacteriaceae bacterium]|nr:GNAT family N-acetyltransferase [Coriobacteriaceae bacterium]
MTPCHGFGQVRVRAARPDDAPALAAIYAPYVRDTAITFEYEAPGTVEFERRMREVLAFYPYLVAECDGAPVGYAYASPFKGRPAYDWAVETSIYVKRGYVGAGVGRALHDALERALAAQGILNMYACIATPDGAEDETITYNSRDFHAHLGYRLVGEFVRCGQKAGRWYNMVWMEKMIGEHVPDCPAPRPFPALLECHHDGALY